MENLTDEEFQSQVQEHKMEVLAKDGVNRTVRFAKPGTSINHFYVTTWPGHICISGDMGTYVFARIQDMAQFFDSTGSISYYTEKLQAGVAKEYDQDCALETLHEIRECSLLRPITNEMAQDYIDGLELDDEYSFAEALRNWDASSAGFDIDLADIQRPERYKYHYIWCIKALIWATARIRKWESER